MADTDNEHDLTVDFARNILLQIGCKPVQIVKRVYSEAEFERRRQSLMKRLPKKQTIRMGAYRGVIMSSLAVPETKFDRPGFEQLSAPEYKVRLMDSRKIL